LSENSNKNKRTWCYADSFLFEDPEWITKIKTFKITKYPKTHKADILDHGSHPNVIETIDAVIMSNVSDIRNNVKTDTAQMSIEGGNSSRLRITVLKQKDEEKSVAQSMTMKEYMCSISNEKIEEAVRRVKENCSSENIQVLAYTIKKYRPESAADVKQSQSLM